MISRPRGTPTTCAASSSASTRGLATPPEARTFSASRTADRRGWRVMSDRDGPCSDRLGPLRRRQSREHVAEVAVQHRGEVVRLVADPVIGDPVLREVVGADPLAAVDGAYLAAPLVARRRGRLLTGGRQQAGAQDAERGLPVLQLALLVLRAHDDAAGQVGDADGGVG